MDDARNTSNAVAADAPPRRSRGHGGIETRKSDGACRGHFRDARSELVRMPWCTRRLDAEEQLQAALEALENTNGVAAGGLTLRAWGTDFLERRELDGGRNASSERLLWKKHIAEADFIDWPVESIMATDVRSWMRRMNAKKTHGRGDAGPASRKATQAKRPKARPLKPPAWQTKTHALNLLRRAFAVAIDEELVSDSFVNPCIGLRFPKPPDIEEQTNFFTRPEIEAVQRIANPGVLPLIEFAIATAVRQGEMRALRDEDVHLDGETPSMTVRYGKPPRKPTKSGKPRVVPLLPMAVRALRAWYEFRTGWCEENPEGLTFPAQRGGYRSAGKFLSRDHHVQWKALLKAAGISRHLVWHDLRHTGATALLGGFFGHKWRLEEIRQLLGHKDLETTQRYAHALQETLNEAARATWGDIGSRSTEASPPRPGGPAVGTHFDPEFDPASLEGLAQVVEMFGRATQESNLRPTAPEAVALSS